MKWLAALSVCALPLCGCIAMGNDTTGYRAGVADGCDAASAAGSPTRTPTRNSALYDSDADYRAGWSSGLATCDTRRNPGRPFRGPPQ